MLENLRRKSLSYIYNNGLHRLHFEGALVRYGSKFVIDVCTQRLSRKISVSSFRRIIDTISLGTFIEFKSSMIYCPKGTFTMGHRDQDDNKPRTEVIDTPFLLGQTEVTQELYEKVMGYNPSYFKNPQNPVECVSWVDAILFCNKLSDLQGLEECYTSSDSEKYVCDFTKKGYRLPREKEWEYAAKAGTKNRWAGTNKEAKLDEYAWFGQNFSNGSTHPVATKKPNEWGLYDMSGNVREWCSDKYDPERRGWRADRVVRGGGWNWNDGTSYLRVAYRHSARPDEDNRGAANIGFRLCRTVV